MEALQACRYVAKNSTHVKLNDGNFDSFKRALKNYRQEEGWASATKRLVQGTKHETEISVLRDALNFNFWRKAYDGMERFETTYKSRKYHGAMAMAACIRRAVYNGIPIYEPDYLRDIEYREADKIFEGNITIPLIDDRIRIMNELGSKGKRLDAFLEKGPRDLWSLVRKLSSTYPSFEDVPNYRGMAVPFFKRAQLLFNTLHEQGYIEVKGLESGTILADYRISQALRELEIIEYSSELAGKVDNLQLIDAGSEEEIEIRALSVVAADELAKKFELPLRQVDDALWQYGRKCSSRHHLTVTTAY